MDVFTADEVTETEKGSPDTASGNADGNRQRDSSDSALSAENDYEDFLRTVRGIRRREQEKRSEILKLCAKRYNVAETDYEALETALSADLDTDGCKARINAMLERLYRDIDSVKELYPSFDIKESLDNRQFFGLCFNGIDPKTAYEIIHRDDIILSAIAYAVESLRNAGAVFTPATRPLEGALKTVSGIKQEKPALSKNDRRELIKRAERGEIIKL